MMPHSQSDSSKTQILTKSQKRGGFFRGILRFTAFLARWSFILLFSVVLLGGLYFRAPWQILVLDAVLLALLTVVPKEKRKYGWGALIIAALGVTGWVFMPEKDTPGWKSYTFDEEVAELNEKYGVPEEENAAPYYEKIEVTDFYEDRKALDVLASDYESKGPDLWDPNGVTLDRPWKAEEFPEVAEWLEEEKEKIAPFFEAVKYDKCWFEVESDPTGMLIFKRASKIKNTVMAIRRMIYLDLGNDDAAGAIYKIKALYQCAYHCLQQTSQIENLVGISIIGMANLCTRHIAIDFPAEREKLKSLETEIYRFDKDWEQYVTRILDYKNVNVKNLMGRLFEVNEKGDIRFTRDPIFVWDFFPYAMLGVEEPSEYWQERKNKFRRFIRHMTYNQSPQELAAALDERYSRMRCRLVNKEFDCRWAQNWQDYLEYDFTLETITKLYAELIIPAYRHIYKIYNRCENDKKATSIVLALREYKNENGDWPDDLDQIRDRLDEGVFVDKLSGKEFVYKRPEGYDKFVFYSMGEDGIDNGGMRGRDEKTGEKRDDFLFWPKSEEELEEVTGKRFFRQDQLDLRDLFIENG